MIVNNNEMDKPMNRKKRSSKNEELNKLGLQRGSVKASA